MKNISSLFCHHPPAGKKIFYTQVVVTSHNILPLVLAIVSNLPHNQEETLLKGDREAAINIFNSEKSSMFFNRVKNSAEPERITIY